MQSNIVLDTSFVSALLNSDDSNHLKARNIFLSIDQNLHKFVVPRTVLLELVSINTEQIKLTRKFVMEFALSLIDEFIDINYSFCEGFEKFLTKNNPKIKAMDGSILYTAIELDANLLTFDKKLEKIYLKFKKYQDK